MSWTDLYPVLAGTRSVGVQFFAPQDFRWRTWALLVAVRLVGGLRQDLARFVLLGLAFAITGAEPGPAQAERDNRLRLIIRTDAIGDHTGALYPTNTTHPRKEGDTMTLLYLVPTV